LKRLSNLIFTAIFLIGLLFSCQGLDVFEQALLSSELYLGNPQVAHAQAFIIARRSTETEQYVTYRFVAYVPGKGIETFTNEDIVYDIIVFYRLSVGQTISVDYLVHQPSISALSNHDPELHQSYLFEKYSSSLIFYCGLGSICFLPTSFIIIVATISALAKRQSPAT
jgi:hypothetical protein